MVRDWVCALSLFSCLKIWSWKPNCGGWSQRHRSASCFHKATDAKLGRSHSNKALLQTKRHRKNSLCKGCSELSGKLLWRTLLPDLLVCHCSQDRLSAWAGGAQGCWCLPDDSGHTLSDSRPEQIRPANGTVTPARITTAFLNAASYCGQKAQAALMAARPECAASPAPPMPCP